MNIFSFFSLIELFDGRTSSTSHLALQLLHSSSLKDKDGSKRTPFVWTAEDDALLKSIVDQYSANWVLIADSFNSIRKSTPADARGPIDCFEHWKSKWGQSERNKIVSDAAHTSTSTEDGSTASGSGQMTTRGLKRLNPSASEAVTGTNGPMTTEAKKRRRHLLLSDSIRKAVKKRTEMAQKALGA